MRLAGGDPDLLERLEAKTTRPQLSRLYVSKNF